MRRLYPNRSASSVHQLYVHLVFITKFRRKHVFPKDAPLSSDDPSGPLSTRRPDLLVALEQNFAETCGELKAQLIAARADDDTGDHVHLIVGYPPTLSIATLVNRLKISDELVLHPVHHGTSVLVAQLHHNRGTPGIVASLRIHLTLYRGDFIGSRRRRWSSAEMSVLVREAMQSLTSTPLVAPRAGIPPSIRSPWTRLCGKADTPIEADEAVVGASLLISARN